MCVGCNQDRTQSLELPRNLLCWSLPETSAKKHWELQQEPTQSIILYNVASSHRAWLLLKDQFGTDIDADY